MFAANGIFSALSKISNQFGETDLAMARLLKAITTGAVQGVVDTVVLADGSILSIQHSVVDGVDKAVVKVTTMIEGVEESASETFTAGTEFFQSLQQWEPFPVRLPMFTGDYLIEQLGAGAAMNEAVSMLTDAMASCAQMSLDTATTIIDSTAGMLVEDAVQLKRDLALISIDGRITPASLLGYLKTWATSAKETVQDGSLQLDVTKPATIQSMLSTILPGVISGIGSVAIVVGGAVVKVLGVIALGVGYVWDRISAYPNALTVSNNRDNGYINGPVLALSNATWNTVIDQVSAKSEGPFDLFVWPRLQGQPSSGYCCNAFLGNGIKPEALFSALSTRSFRFRRVNNDEVIWRPRVRGDAACGFDWNFLDSDFFTPDEWMGIMQDPDMYTRYIAAVLILTQALSLFSDARYSGADDGMTSYYTVNNGSWNYPSVNPNADNPGFAVFQYAFARVTDVSSTWVYQLPDGSIFPWRQASVADSLRYIQDVYNYYVIPYQELDTGFVFHESTVTWFKDPVNFCVMAVMGPQLLNADPVPSLPITRFAEIPAVTAAQATAVIVATAAIAATTALLVKKVSRAMRVRRSVKQTIRLKELNDARQEYLNDPHNNSKRLAYQKALAAYDRRATLFGWGSYNAVTGMVTNATPGSTNVVSRFGDYVFTDTSEEIANQNIADRVNRVYYAVTGQADTP